MNVDKAQGDASKVTAKGPGLEAAGNIANKPTYFDIYTAGKRPLLQGSGFVGKPEIILRNLKSSDAGPLSLKQTANSKNSFFQFSTPPPCPYTFIFLIYFLIFQLQFTFSITFY